MAQLWRDDMEMKTNEFFRKAREARGFNLRYVTDALEAMGVDISEATLSRMERGSPMSYDVVKGLCRLYGVSLGQLDRIEQGETISESSAGYSSPGRQLPLISWVQAGNWAGMDDPLSGDSFFVPGFTPASAFCLRVSGDSMTAADKDQISFPDGCIIVVNPKLTPAKRSFVIAVSNKTHEATFKQLIEDCGQWYLKPINPQYPVMKVTEDMEVKGVVIRKLEDVPI